MVSLSFGHAWRYVVRRLERSRWSRRRRISPDQPPALELLESRLVPTGTWTRLTQAAPETLGVMMLLSDGTVMAAGGTTRNEYSLTPDSYGLYYDGTWSQRASMHDTRLYSPSEVLDDGRVFVAGGEYGSGSSNGEIYTPWTDTWTSIPRRPLSNPDIGDTPSEILLDGTILVGSRNGPQTSIYDPWQNIWYTGPNKLRNDSSSEETYLKLPDDSVLSYDVFNLGHGQRYVPSSGTWVDTGPAPNNLSSSGVGYELGPAFMLPDGRAFYLGATGRTAFYDLSTNTWTSGPTIPNGLGADDAPGAMMPNGKILFAADRPLFNGPTSIFEFDPTTNQYTNVTPAGFPLSGSAFINRMVMLPSGEVLLANSASSQPIIYTPDGYPDASWQPTIAGVTDNGDGSFLLTGTQLNGISEGASYGDDAEMSSNYPLVELVNVDDGTTYFAPTSYWSNTGVTRDSTPESTYFVLPAGASAGTYDLYVIASGIASDPVLFTIGAGLPGTPGQSSRGISALAATPTVLSTVADNSPAPQASALTSAAGTNEVIRFAPALGTALTASRAGSVASAPLESVSGTVGIGLTDQEVSSGRFEEAFSSDRASSFQDDPFLPGSSSTAALAWKTDQALDAFFIAEPLDLPLQEI